ncbi:MAG: glycosyltransferase [Chloroflexi bacterium]|nr:glycosyltransferase [Chloroflexota bacterium]
MSPSLPSPFEGGVLQLFHFLRLLKKEHGHHIDLISLLQQPAPLGPSPEELWFCDTVQTIKVPRSGSAAKWLYGLRALVSPRHLFGGSHTFLNPGYSPVMQRTVEQTVASNHLDVILVHNLYTAFYAWDAGLPVVSHIDCPFPELFRRWMQSTSWLKLPVKLLALVMYWANLREARRVYDKGFYALVTAGSQDLPIWRRYVPDMNIAVIPNGVDTEYFAPGGAESREPALVFTGTMSSTANVSAVLAFYRRVFPRIRAQISGVRFNVVGQGPPEEIRELGRDPAVLVTGSVPDVRPYLQEGWVAVVPTTVGMGCSNKILEAMAMGKAVVTTQAQGAGLSIARGREAAIAENDEEFAEQVVALLRDSARRATMGRAARALVEKHYTWVAATQRLNALLEEAVRVNGTGQ